MRKQSNCLKVSKQLGENAIELAGKLGIINSTLEIWRDENYLCIPLIREPSEKDLNTIRHLPNFQFTTEILDEKKPCAKTLVQFLDNILPPFLLSALPQALDVVGDIAIIEIPLELQNYENEIGKAVLKTHKNVKTVLAKVGAVRGPYRIREFKFIAGENKTQTIHKEFGCNLHVDLAKAYFSPRLSYEHQRVASLVEGEETVVDLFAGVGPFSILIAKRNPKARIYAIDINQDAIELLKINIRVNRVENRVFPLLGDAKQLISNRLWSLADRVIMNLPETAIEFVGSACQAIKPSGGIIHFYSFVRSPDSIESLKQRFSITVEKNSRKIQAFLVDRRIRETAPYESQVVLDVKIL